MRKYRVNAGTAIRVAYGIELVAGLSCYPQTAPTGAEFEKHNDELDAQGEVSRKLQKPMLQARAKQRFAELSMRKTIRSASRALEIVEGGRRGLLCAQIFPDGVGPVVKPSGAPLQKSASLLVQRIQDCKFEGIVDYRKEWLPKLAAERDSLDATATAFGAVKKAYDDAFSLERALRAKHRNEVDKVMGMVRVIFPGDTATHDTIFPDLNDSQADTGADDAPATPQGSSSPPKEETQPAPAPAPAPAPVPAPVPTA